MSDKSANGMRDWREETARRDEERRGVTDRRVEAARQAVHKLECRDDETPCEPCAETATVALAAADAVDAPALAEARQLLADILHVFDSLHDGDAHKAYAEPNPVCDACAWPWPCPVERARRWLAEQETS